MAEKEDASSFAAVVEMAVVDMDCMASEVSFVVVVVEGSIVGIWDQHWVELGYIHMVIGVVVHEVGAWEDAVVVVVVVVDISLKVEACSWVVVEVNKEDKAVDVQAVDAQVAVDEVVEHYYCTS